MIPSRVDEESTFRQKCVYRIPRLGYSIYKQKVKLKVKYVGLPGPQLGRLRKDGVEVTSSHRELMLMFLGDTTHKVFERYKNILEEHKVVVVECSFTDENDLERADTTKHMHWRALQPHVDANPEVLFVLIHFTLKQKRSATIFSTKFNSPERAPHADRRRD